MSRSVQASFRQLHAACLLASGSRCAAPYIWSTVLKSSRCTYSDMQHTHSFSHQDERGLLCLVSSPIFSFSWWQSNNQPWLTFAIRAVGWVTCCCDVEVRGSFQHVAPSVGEMSHLCNFLCPPTFSVFLFLRFLFRSSPASLSQPLWERKCGHITLCVCISRNVCGTMADGFSTGIRNWWESPCPSF